VHDSIIDVSPFLVLRETIGRVQREGKKNPEIHPLPFPASRGMR
jgi:hypothetical protein